LDNNRDDYGSMRSVLGSAFNYASNIALGSSAAPKDRIDAMRAMAEIYTAIVTGDDAIDRQQEKAQRPKSGMQSC
jgi:hypothetical protein